MTNGLTNNFGSYTAVQNFTAWPHNTIANNEAALNGHFDLLGMTHDFTLGTNGYLNRQYSYRNTIFQVLNVTNTSYFSSTADGNIAGSPGANTAQVAPPRVFQTSLEFTF